MAGAVLTHLFILGPSTVLAIRLGLLCDVVFYIYCAQILKVLNLNNFSDT